jgi:hypothetical protein
VKNKKLFAILTLVCFMFTLMPVAAFAADEFIADQVYVKVDGGTWDTEVDVETGKAVTAEMGSSATYSNVVFYAVDAEGNGVAIKPAAKNAEFTFKAPGVYEIYGVDFTGAKSADVTDVNALIASVGALKDGKDVKDVVNTVETWAKQNQKELDDYATVNVEAPEAKYTVELSKTTASVDLDNGFSSDKVTVTVKNDSKAVKAADVEVVAPSFVSVVPVKDAVTDKDGEIEYRITANKVGTFNVFFKYEDAKAAKLVVSAGTNEIANISVEKEPTAPQNIAAKNTGVQFKVVDGYDVNTAKTALTYGVDYVVTVVEQPAKSKLEGKDFALTLAKDKTGIFDLTTGKAFKEGKYVVNVRLENGKNATASFEMAKMGDVVGIRFVQPATTVALNSAAPTFTVQSYDANGVTNTLTDGVDYVLSANGSALVNNAGSLFKVSGEEKYIGSTVTVLAKTVDNQFIATTALEVVADGMEVVYATTTAEVGVTTTLKANVVDAKGNNVAVPVSTTGGAYDIKVIVLDKPANAYVSADFSKVDKKDIQISFLASVAGEYKIQTIVVDANNEFVTGIETITVGVGEGTFKDVVVVSIGADQIVVNSDVKEIPAPAVIKDSRTFVPFRALAEAFGAVVDYDQATGAVTAELNGVKVVMMNGEKAYTVNGVAKVADVAPYLNVEASTTMVPVSFVAKAFGINYQCIYAADGTVADVLFTK